MKNCIYICGILGRIILTLLGVGIFVSTYIGYPYLGLTIPNGFCTVRSEIVLAKEGDSTALFLYPNYNFSFMARTMKNCGTANHSTRTSTCAHDTSKSLYSKFQIEMDAKNQAYAFILSRGLLSEFTAFSHAHSGECQSLESRLEMILKNC